jgi:hypothetical protein
MRPPGKPPRRKINKDLKSPLSLFLYCSRKPSRMRQPFGRSLAMPDSTVFAFPRNDQDRLRLALRRLEEAVAEQRAALRDFRASLGELRQAATGLEGSLTGYREVLDGTTGSLCQAQDAAQQLHETATRMEAMR